MSEPFMSQIEVFGFTFPPRNWLPCTGQSLPIRQYQALFALLGTTYGGDGVNTFNLPDLRGRLAIGMGPGPGLTDHTQGQTVGQPTQSISQSQMPAVPHTHTVNASNATTGGTNAPGPSVALASAYTSTTPPTTQNIYSTDTASVAMGSLSAVGGQPHNNMMPCLSLNYCICIAGLFPSRN